MANVFEKIHHICIVVENLEKSVCYYEKIGIGPWYDYPKHGKYIDFQVPNPEASSELKYRCCDLENMQLQLCQPSQLDSPQRRFLDKHGEGVYHLGFEVKNLDLAENEVTEIGVKLTAKGRREDGTGFTYFDTRDEAGVILEIRK